VDGFLALVRRGFSSLSGHDGPYVRDMLAIICDIIVPKTGRGERLAEVQDSIEKE
jgi:hypothetical protein